METIRRTKYFGELTLWNQSSDITKAADTILEGLKNLALNIVNSIIIKSFYQKRYVEKTKKALTSKTVIFFLLLILELSRERPVSINQSGDVQLKRARAEGLQEDHPHQQTVEGLQEDYGADDQPIQKKKMGLEKRPVLDILENAVEKSQTI